MDDSAFFCFNLCTAKPSTVKRCTHHQNSREREKKTHTHWFFTIFSQPIPSLPIPCPLPFLFFASLSLSRFLFFAIRSFLHHTALKFARVFSLQFLHRPSLARRMRCFGFPDDGDRVSAAEGDAAVAVPDGVDPKMAENRSDELDDAAPTAGAD